MKIILGSGSPRRKELLAQTGYDFEVLVSEADENIATMKPVKMVEELSYRKARAVVDTLLKREDNEDYLVIGADTIVVLDNQILGKPADKEAAYQMMRNLSDRTHQVYTGVSFLVIKNGVFVYSEKMHEQTDVKIREMSEEEIADYIENTDEWRDKAGGYGIQTAFGAKFIPGIKGDYYNVVGLPACAVGQKIAKLLHKRFSIADVYHALGQPLDTPCGGNGTCGKCKVTIRQDGVEKEVLACQTSFQKGIELILEKKEEKKAKILTGSEEENEFYTTDEENTGEQGIGLAIDIGTTTVAAYAYNLSTGARLSVKSALNRQIIHGADVIARIQYASEVNQLVQLRQEILDTINQLIEEMCQENEEITVDVIQKIVLCGNSTMQHLFFGWSPEALGKAPYVNFNEEPVIVRGKKSKLLCNKEAKVIFLPLMGSFVGADTLSCLLTLPKDKKIRLLVDLGTNGEIALGNSKDGYSFCSTACGPALEGANLDCGMRGTEGAIEKVKFEKGHVLCQTIGNVSPTGICGSGVISAVSALFDAGIINEEGNLLSKRAFLMKHPGNLLATKIKEVEPNNLAFFLVKGAHPVYLSQEDIRKVQMAKSAIFSGCMMLAKQRGIRLEDIDELVLAGAFGNYIDVNDAMNIGLLPHFPKEKIRSIGNGAGSGVQDFLFNDSLEEEAEKIRARASHINLAEIDEFRDMYIKEMRFGSETPTA